MLTILFDGIAYGMLLFVLACGLSITLGLMNFINLAHGAFAMAGGYCTVILVNRLGVPFALGLPIAFLATAALGGLLERTLYVHVYARNHLDQVLFTIGLVFMSVAAVDYVMGSSQQFVVIPEALQGQFNVFGVGMSKYRLLIILVCGLLTIALQLLIAKTRFGSEERRDVSAAEAVNRLLGVPDDEQIPGLWRKRSPVGRVLVRRDPHDQLGLDRVGVLELVDEDPREAAVEVVAHGRVFRNEVARPQQ